MRSHRLNIYMICLIILSGFATGSHASPAGEQPRECSEAYVTYHATPYWDGIMVPLDMAHAVFEGYAWDTESLIEQFSICLDQDMLPWQRVMALYSRGMVRKVAGQADGAESDFGAALQGFDAALASNWIPKRQIGSRAMILMELGRYREAEASLNEFMATFKDDDADDQARLLQIRGLIRMLDGRWEEALADLDRSAALDDYSSFTFAIRSLTHLFLDRYQASEADAERAVYLDSTSTIWTILNTYNPPPDPM